MNITQLIEDLRRVADIHGMHAPVETSTECLLGVTMGAGCAILEIQPEGAWPAHEKCECVCGKCMDSAAVGVMLREITADAVRDAAERAEGLEVMDRNQQVATLSKLNPRLADSDHLHKYWRNAVLECLAPGVPNAEPCHGANQK